MPRPLIASIADGGRIPKMRLNAAKILNVASEEKITMPTLRSALARVEAFCKANNLRIPILLAPMAGACPASLSIAVANAGGLGACGALLMQPAAIKTWASEVRAGSNGGFQLNLW